MNTGNVNSEISLLDDPDSILNYEETTSRMSELLGVLFDKASMSRRDNGFGEDTGLKNNRSGVTNASYVSSTENVNISPTYSPPKSAYFSETKISIPNIDSTSFSWRKLWAFTGPGFLISIAFLDPGNVQCDLQAGTSARYKLLWVVLWSTVLGLYVQWLSARLGVVTGYHLAELCYQEYKKLPRIFVWLMMEIAIIGSDMQEVIGTAIALYLLSDTRIPVWAGVLITVIDTFTFLLLDKYGLRKLEMFFAFLITVMALSFGYEFIIVGQDTEELLQGLIIPYCSDCSTNSWLLGVGIVGAVIMPHNLYLHSGLVKSRDIDRNKPEKVKEANMYFFIETAICLAVSLVINIFVLSVFAHELSGKTNAEVRNVCLASNSSYTGYFENNNELAEMDIYSGGLFLGCRFGLIAMYIWAIGILAAGQSSTMTGCYAGQFSMEGFLNLKWSRWRRVLFTRLTAILPTFLVAFYSNIRDLSGMNDLLNAIMSLQLPFAAIPLVAFTSNPRIMGKFVNGIFDKILSILILIIVLAINFAFVYFGSTDISSHWLILTAIVIYSVVYILICIYLVVHMILGMFERSESIRI